MKTIRRSVYRAQLEAQLSKYERRIQKMAENAYKIRQVIETLQREELSHAVHQADQQGSIGSGSVDNGTGGTDVHDSAVVAPVLEEQPAELRDDSGDLGVNSGSAV